MIVCVSLCVIAVYRGVCVCSFVGGIAIAAILFVDVAPKESPAFIRWGRVFSGENFFVFYF